MAFWRGSVVSGASPRLIIAGGGLAGCLAALALAERRPDVSFLLIEEGARFGGNHVWSFFDPDVADDDHWLIEPLVGRRWRDHEVRFPQRLRTLGFGYNAVRSPDLNSRMRSRLGRGQYRLGSRIAELSPNHVTLAG